MSKIVFYLIFLVSNLFSTGFPDEYYEIKDIKKMKEYFFSHMLKISKEENEKILRDRFFVKNIFFRVNDFDKGSPLYKQFKQIQERYKLTDKNSLDDYMMVIDMIPNSLILAQSSVESGWGKSRFFKEANNIFGQWTWSGKGLAPKDRDEGKKHKIKIFNTLDHSIRGYMINLNLSWGYKEFRELRARMRLEDKPLDGFTLAGTLQNYSQRKWEYTKTLQKVIRQNNLTKYDKKVSDIL